MQSLPKSGGTGQVVRNQDGELRSRANMPLPAPGNAGQRDGVAESGFDV
jgi:hypothetical protein